MCGITGFIDSNKKNLNQETILKMTKIIAHRGPDDEGIFLDKKIALGHRRLAIIDLTPAGHQPMFNEDKNIVLVYNGEIYNFKGIRKTLLRLGHKFSSQSDTEVIIHAYEEYGENCVKKFNGMWAFALYDQKRHQIFISRDRYGIKPLYYFYDGEKFIFASEIKSILAYPGIKAEVNYEALNEYFTFQNILSNQTLFKNINLLEPGFNLLVSLDDLNISKNQYWDVSFAKRNLTQNQWEEKLEETTKSSVWRHLISDVPVGILLSGGMDSGTIACFAAQKIKEIVTFTGGFDLTRAGGKESDLDERKEAEMIARLFSAEHYENVMYSSSPEWAMPKLIWHLEDLRLGMSYPQYYLAKLASGFVKVALSGSGGDELFGGYLWRYQLVRNIFNQEKFDKIYYNYWSRLVKDREKKLFFSEPALKKLEIERPFREYQRVIKPAYGQSPLEKALYFEQKTFLPGFLIVEDKLFMAHSMEVRVPFTDYELMKISHSMPAKLKINEKYGKIILRKTMEKYLPKEIIYKKKTGFTPPQGSWYRNESAAYIREILLAERALGRGYFRPEYIRKVVNDHVAGRGDYRLLIWSLLSFEWWNRIFLEGEGKVYES